MQPIPAELRARLASLRIVPRGAAGASGFGLHASRSRGAGLEFAEYRPYVAGDEPQRIDWTLYARSDRWYVREAERDSALALWILLDATASMRQADLARPGYRKIDAARALAAAAIELALRQGDRFGLLIAGDSGAPLALGAGSRHRDRCLLTLERCEARGVWPPERALAPLLERFAGGALVLVLSDFFDPGPVELALRLARAGRDLRTIQLIGADERDFPLRGGWRLRDPETDAERVIDAGRAREDFLRRFGAALAALARRFASAGVLHCEHALDHRLEAPLRRVLALQAAPVAR